MYILIVQSQLLGFCKDILSSLQDVLAKLMSHGNMASYQRNKDDMFFFWNSRLPFSECL